MRVHRSRRSLLKAAAALGLTTTTPTWAQPFDGGIREAYGARFNAEGQHVRRRIRSGRARALNSLREWHEIALEATGIDHTPVSTGDSRTFGEQLGPGRSSRAMAIVHIAMFDALNAIGRRYQGYTNIDAATSPRIRDAAVMQAAHDTCAALFPSQRADLDEALAQDLAELRDLSARARGVEVGQRAPRQLSPSAPTTIRSPRAAHRRGIPAGKRAACGDPIPSVRFRLPSVRAGRKSSLSLCGQLLSSACPRPPRLIVPTTQLPSTRSSNSAETASRRPPYDRKPQSQIGVFWAYTACQVCVRHRACTTRSRCRSLRHRQPSRWSWRVF